MQRARAVWLAAAAVILGSAFPGLVPCAWAAATEGHGGSSPDLTSRMMVLALQVGVILFAARIGNMLFQRLKMPGVLGELCMGVVIGPYMLGGLGIPGLRGFEQGVFGLAPGVAVGAAPVSPELYGICSVASIVLLFLVGLETDIKLFLRYAVAGGLVGLGGVVFSFAVGDLLGVWLLPRIMPGNFTFVHPACIFLGVMSTATSVSITARILSERRKLESPEGVTILAGAVIDDVLGIIMLAIGMGVIGSSGGQGHIDWGLIGVIAGKSFGIWLVATIVGILAAHHIGRLLKLFGGSSEIAMMALGLALIVAGLFEEAHLAMIIGSYVMGLSLSRTDISHVIREHLGAIYAFMVPVFFVVMGMMVDLPQLFSPRILGFGLLYTVLAVVAKLLGCGLPTLACGFNLRGALRIGVGMIPRGEVALIAAGIGLASGYLSKEVFGVAIMMTLLTTVLSPPLLVWAFNLKGSGVRRQQTERDAASELHYDFPSPEVADLMLNHLLESFRKEGFFVHGLNMAESLYQLRRDAMIIGVRRTGTRIVFECDPDEKPYLRTAMVEAVAEFEQIVHELRKPMDTLGAEATAEETLRLDRLARWRRYLAPDRMLPLLRADSADSAIEELLAKLAATGAVRDLETARTAVLRRESAMPTGLRHGIACPHARTDAVTELVCAVGLHPTGIDFHAMDGLPARVILLVLTPTSAIAPYMEFMAMLQSVLDEEGLKRVLACQTGPGMFDALTRRPVAGA